MSIFFNIGRNPNPDYIEIDCEFIDIKNLKVLISKKIGVAQKDMKIKHYAPYQYIKKGSSVSIQITVKNYLDEPIKFHEIVSHQRLQSMMTDCRFYIAKSSNEDNIQKARDCSVWATTYPNQVQKKTPRISLEQRFNVSNISYQLKGLARMESQPDKIPDKSIWNGVGNIRLGGNFKLRWIRKKPLSLSTIQKKLGVQAKDQILKATDGYEPDAQIAKKIALLFQLPLQPYYKLQDLVEIKKQQKQQKMLFNGESKRNSAFINAHLATMMLKNLQQSANIDQLGIVKQHFQIPKIQEPKKKNSKKAKNKSKKKVKKDRKKKRKRSSSSSSSSRSSSSDSRSRSRSRSRSNSSSSSEHRAKRQKVSTTQRTKN